MTQEEFVAVVRRALGERVHYDARPILRDLIGYKKTTIYLKHEWIRNPRFYQYVTNETDLDFGFFSEEGCEVMMMHFGEKMKDSILKEG